MKSIAELYLAYLEMTVISMVLASLAFISVSGFAYGGRGTIPAVLSLGTLALIGYVAIDRSRVLREHSELKRRPFGEIRLFLFTLQRKISRIIGSSQLNSREQVTRWNLSRVLAFIVLALTIVTFSISANIALKLQAIAGARLGIPATFFNRALVIDVLQIADGGSPRVTAVLRADGYPELRIEGETPGYETIYEAGPSRFLVRVLEIDGTTVRFFVERQGKYPS